MPRDYIVCYDIADPRRLQRVHRYVANEAEFLQKSVYRLSADKASLKGFVSVLEELICPRTDDVRLYPLSSRVTLETWGKEVSLAGIHLLE